MSTAFTDTPTSRYHGLRMTAEEYYQLEEDGSWYELIDGVVCMSPSPAPRHQTVALRLSACLLAYLDKHPIGQVFHEIDVHLGKGPRGSDLVYRPDIIFLRREPDAPIPARITGAPDLIIEVVSPSSRRLDHETKKTDYERCGVGEYWIIDPQQRAFTFYRLQDGRYVQLAPEADKFASQALPGFVLDLNSVRRSFD